MSPRGSSPPGPASLAWLHDPHVLRIALLVAAVSLLRAGRETPASATPPSREEPRHAPHA